VMPTALEPLRRAQLSCSRYVPTEQPGGHPPRRGDPISTFRAAQVGGQCCRTPEEAAQGATAGPTRCSSPDEASTSTGVATVPDSRAPNVQQEQSCYRHPVRTPGSMRLEVPRRAG
jgi:hypothetical protein